MSRAALFAAGALLLVTAAIGACGVDEPDDSSSSGDDDTSSSDATTVTSTSTGQGGAGGGSSTSAQGGAASTSGSGGAPPCPGLGDACTDCLAWQCSDRYCGCYNNPTCGTLLECLQACGPNNPSCSTDCAANNANGIADAYLVGDCAATTCAGSCPGTGTDISPCEECLYAQCENEMNTCVSQTDCAELLQCVAACPQGDSQCQNGCAFQNPFAVTDATAVGDCSKAHCAAECGT